MSDKAEPLLSVRGVTVRFGGIVALDGVSFDVQRGHICGLIGPNGAGKTTLFNCLSRLYQYQAGDILFEGKSITATADARDRRAGHGPHLPEPGDVPHHAGAARTSWSVRIAARRRASCPARCACPACRRRGKAPARARRRDHGLPGPDAVPAPRRSATCRSASRSAWSSARALAADPKLLLLDEPAAGLNHEELAELARLIRDMRDRLGITVLLVEHHMSLVMGVSDHIVALNFGRKIAEGNPAHIQKHPGRDRGLPRGTRRCLSCWRSASCARRTVPPRCCTTSTSSLEAGHITAILGANGAGKTTTLRALCQIVRTSGSILFDGQQLVGKSTESVVRMGVAHVPDGRGTFTGLVGGGEPAAGRLCRAATRPTWRRTWSACSRASRS